MSEHPVSHIPATSPQTPRSRRLSGFVVALLLILSLSLGAARIAGAEMPAGSTTATALTAQESTQPDSASIADVAAKANPAVVTVYTFVDSPAIGGGFDPVQPGQQPASDTIPTAPDGTSPLGAGSGWIYDEQGHVVTNAHVVTGADAFTVQYYDGSQVEATLIGIDRFRDVAVLQLTLKAGETVPGVAEVGDSSAIRAGDQVVAIGSPLGEFTNTVSDGIIGGLDRTLDDGNGTALSHLIQHDAELSPGNSGGPLLNLQGEVIGMNVAKVETTQTGGVTAAGLNFAIDGNTVVQSVDEIISTGASVAYPYLGIQTQLTEQGQLVATVEAGSPADDAGLRAGDVISALDGQEIGPESSFVSLLLEHRPGDEVDLTVLRNGAETTIPVTLGVRPDGV